METKTLIQQESKEGAFLSAVKAKEANRKNLVLVKKKPDSQIYVNILRAVQIGACHPGMIVLGTKIPWITVMQCLRTLEQKGLISSGFDEETGRLVSKLTETGNRVLDEKLHEDLTAAS